MPLQMLRNIFILSRRAFSVDVPSKNPLKIVRFVAPEFTHELAQQLKKKTMKPIDTLPPTIDREIITKFPSLMKVFSREIRPQDLPTYEERVSKTRKLKDSN